MHRTFQPKAAHHNALVPQSRFNYGGGRGQQTTANTSNQPSVPGTKPARSSMDMASGLGSSFDNRKNSSGHEDYMGVLLDKPKFRSLATIESRFNTFKSWPKGRVQNPKTLAEAGFAYIGDGDAVRCYFCGGGFCEWNESHDPWEEHARHYRQCGHVRQCKGDNFVRQVHGEIQEDARAAEGDVYELFEEESDEVKTKNRIAIEAVKEFDFDGVLVDRAVKRLMSLGESRAFTAEDIVKAIEELETSKECVAEFEDIVEGEHEGESTGSEDDQDLEDLEDTNRKLKEGMLCKICFDADACIITLPCRHMISCAQCVPALTRCGLCREPIKATVRVHMTAYK